MAQNGELTSHAEALSERIGGKVSPIVSPNDGCPTVWRDYLVDSHKQRMDHLKVELKSISDVLPLTANALAGVARDVFVADTESEGLLRVIMTEIEGDLYPVVSSPPDASILFNPKWTEFTHNAPSKFVRIYAELFNGLTDSYKFGGPRPLAYMARWSEENFDFTPYLWSKSFLQSHDPSDFLGIFDSGGGGYLYLDLSLDQSKSTNAVVTLFLSDHDEPLEQKKPFWDYLDQWTAMGIADG